MTFLEMVINLTCPN